MTSHATGDLERGITDADKATHTQGLLSAKN